MLSGTAGHPHISSLRRSKKQQVGKRSCKSSLPSLLSQGLEDMQQNSSRCAGQSSLHIRIADTINGSGKGRSGKVWKYEKNICNKKKESYDIYKHWESCSQINTFASPPWISNLVGSTSKLTCCHSEDVITVLNKGSKSFCKYVAPYTCVQRKSERVARLAQQLTGMLWNSLSVKRAWKHLTSFDTSQISVTLVFLYYRLISET